MKVLNTIKVSVSEPKITKEQLDWWVDVMNKQDMLQNKAPDTTALIAQ
jgi:hypothetical protein